MRKQGLCATAIAFLFVVLAIANLIALTSPLSAQASSQRRRCVIIVGAGRAQVLCAMPNTNFVGSFDVLESPYLKAVELAYVGKGINYSGVIAMKLDSRSVAGLIVVNVSSSIISGGSGARESVFLVMHVSKRIARIDVFRYSMYIVGRREFNKTMSVDITKYVAEALEKIKYFDSVGKVFISVRPEGKGNVVSIDASGATLDIGMYAYLKGLESVCKYLSRSEGSASATLLISGRVISATFEARGDVYGELSSISCLVPLALDVASAIASGSEKSPLRVVSELETLSVLLKFSRFIPVAITGFAKPLLLTYELFENTTIAGARMKVVGNGSLAALNLTIWGSVPAKDVKNVSMTVVKELGNVLPLSPLRDDLLETLGKAVVIVKGTHTMISTRSTARTPPQPGLGIGSVLYILIAVLIAQAVIVAYLLIRVWRR